MCYHTSYQGEHWSSIPLGSSGEPQGAGVLKHQLSPHLRVIPGGTESLAGRVGASSLISQQSSVGAGS